MPTKHLPAITGYLENIPDSSIDCFADISVFRKTEICKLNRIMVGATRFANHSCRPICRYNIANVGRRKVIKLEMLLPINCGHKITAIYSSEYFFGNANVNCLFLILICTLKIRLVLLQRKNKRLFPGKFSAETKKKKNFCFCSTEGIKRRPNEIRNFI